MTLPRSVRGAGVEVGSGVGRGAGVEVGGNHWMVAVGDALGAGEGVLVGSTGLPGLASGVQPENVKAAISRAISNNGMRAAPLSAKKLR